MVAIPLSQVLGATLSGFIIQCFNGLHGLAGWKWLFLLESIPALIVGFTTLLYLDSGIRGAKWLTDPEKELCSETLHTM